MDKNGLVIVFLLLFMIVLSRSDAFNSRKLVTDPNNSSINIANQNSPPPDDKKPNLSPESTKSKDNPNRSPSTVESEGLNDNKKLDKVKNQEGNQTQTKTFDSKSCKGNSICNDQEKTMIACIQDFENGSDKLTLLVQNERDVDLKGNITASMNNNLNLPFEIPAHGTEKVNITLSGDKNTKIILNAGNGDCELQISQPKTPQVNTPSKSKNPENNSNTKDINNPTDTPTKPEKVNDPTKSKEVNDPSKDKITDSPNPKETDDTKKPTNVDDDKKSKEVNVPPKSKEVNDPPKSKDENNPPKSKDENEHSKPKDENDPSKSKEANDTLELKDENDPTPKPTTSENNFLDQLTFYSKQVTPIYGAYFAFFVALIIGASWALCSFRKRRTDNGIPYQELEMGLPESSNAVNVETVEGWDQDWDDDDWDEDKAIRSPGGGIQNKNISSNGLTSRATKKDGWDAGWDD